MSIVIKMLGLIFYLASLHFPTDSRPIEETAAFRQTVDELLRQCDDGHGIIGRNANARLLLNIAGVTGDLEVDEADEPGLLQTTMMGARRLWVPTTFNHIHSRQLETWRHPSRKRSCIDYIAVSNSWNAAQIQTESWEDLDLPQHEDHTAIYMAAQHPIHEGS